MHITTIQDKDSGVTTVEVVVSSSLRPFGKFGVKAVGVAQCSEPDTFDSEVGYELALGRALAKLGKQVEKTTYKEVHYRDDKRKQAKKASDAALAKRYENQKIKPFKVGDLVNSFSMATSLPKGTQLKNSANDRSKAFDGLIITNDFTGNYQSDWLDGLKMYGFPHDRIADGRYGDWRIHSLPEG